MNSNLNFSFLSLKKENFPAISNLINEQGIAFFNGFEEKSQLLDIAEYLGDIFHHRDSDQHGITHVKNSGEDTKDGFYGFSSKGLSLHTDRSTIPQPPNIMILACKKQSTQGGESLFVDGKEILGEITNDFSNWSHPLLEKDAVIFDDGKNMFKGNVFVKEEDGSYTIRYRRDCFAYFSSTLINEINALQKLIDHNYFGRKLRSGEGYIINNRWWLHGRDSFVGDREFLRILLFGKNTLRKGINFDYSINKQQEGLELV